eukprot:CAMPEP_0170511212 /NCGR_PEP_ID=MMETSP0208-20121228/66177_1 /TAXON_ID=197538 /ORGANISM="Strombidium inclinatum, Strain S3" /LENGTH=77 /DNA_ID=CAMNT_0010794731 /DNA_START=594 /DNA_END=827 /DNA_ORIENTATION=+
MTTKGRGPAKKRQNKMKNRCGEEAGHEEILADSRLDDESSPASPPEDGEKASYQEETGPQYPAKASGDRASEAPLHN